MPSSKNTKIISKNYRLCNIFWLSCYCALSKSRPLLLNRLRKTRTFVSVRCGVEFLAQCPFLILFFVHSKSANCDSTSPTPSTQPSLTQKTRTAALRPGSYGWRESYLTTWVSGFVKHVYIHTFSLQLSVSRYGTDVYEHQQITWERKIVMCP